MLDIRNDTPFQVELLPGLDRDGWDYLTVVVKGTFDIPEQAGPLAIATDQVPVLLADEFFGEPGQSSIRYEADSCLTKVATDVVLNGRAYSPAGPVQQLDVGFQLGAISKTIRVSGDRCWENSVTGLCASAPEPFEVMPLVYERAYGGSFPLAGDGDSAERHTRNPVGRGFMPNRKGLSAEGLPLPNLEDPRWPLQAPAQDIPVAGFGAVARNWVQRRGLAGTYDEAWQQLRCPLLPEDFDPRYFNSAPADQVADGYLQGNESVRLFNLSPQGELAFELPGLLPRVGIETTTSMTGYVTMLDTVLIEPDQRRVCLSWRAAIRVQRQLLSIEAVHVGLGAQH